jgi:hypothetical protein
MTSTMTSQSNRLDKIIQLTHATQMTLRGLKEFAKAEGVLVKFLGVNDGSFLQKQSARNRGVLQESSM